MEITQAEWTRFKNMLSAINTRAVDDMMDWLESKGGIANVSFQEMSSYGYALATKYGEASASLSAQMYDEVAAASGMTLPAAEVADTVSYNEIAKAITKVAAQTQNAKNVSNVVGRYTKRTGADTMLKNAERDGAQFAWVPAGDSCAFCIALASRGWQYISKQSFKNGHAEHIHSNCDCTYAVRFDKKTNVAGYNPQVYADMYYGAEGNTPQEKINYMRRQAYKASHPSEKKASNLRRKESDQKMIEYPRQDQSHEVYDYMKNWAKSENIKSLPVEPLSNKLTEEQIILKIAGGDMTEGSCSSAAYAYIGNRCGYDVTDFRGGNSQYMFSQFSNIDKIDNMPGIKTQTFKLKKEASDLAKTLKELNLEEGKEYRLTAGKHVAIIRNTSEGLQYLELQSNNPEKNGWQFFERTKKYTMFGQEIEEKITMTDTLIKRFGCRKTVDKSKYSSRVYEKTALLTDVDSYKNSAQFKDILGYLNTNVSAQKKGTAGGLK